MAASGIVGFAKKISTTPDSALMVDCQAIDGKPWIIDSGCTFHLKKGKQDLANLRPNKSDIIVADERKMSSPAIGSCGLLQEVRYVPTLCQNLLSVSALCKQDFEFRFNARMCIITNMRTGKTYFAPEHRGLYLLPYTEIFPYEKVNDISMAYLSDSITKNKAELWHLRLHHIAFKKIRHSIKHNLLPKLPGLTDAMFNDIQMCNGCALGNARKLPFPKQTETRSVETLGRIFYDVCGPITPPTLSGKRYFGLIIDDKSNKEFPVFLRTKDESKSKLEHFNDTVAKPENKKIRIMRTDGAKDLAAGQMQSYLKAEGIRHECTTPECSAQNGRAERAIGVTTTMARCVMLQMHVPGFLWDEIINATSWVKNRIPTMSNHGLVSPQQSWRDCKEPVDISYFRAVGCLVFFTLLDQEKVRSKKFDATAVAGALLGYQAGTKGYRVWHPEKRAKLIRRHVYFNETQPGRFYPADNRFQRNGTTSEFVLDLDWGSEKHSDIVVGGAVTKSQKCTAIHQTPRFWTISNKLKTMRNKLEALGKPLK